MTTATRLGNVVTRLSFGAITGMGLLALPISGSQPAAAQSRDRNCAKAIEPSGQGPYPESAFMWPASPALMNREPQAAGAADRGVTGIGGAEPFIERAGDFRKRHSLFQTVA